MDSFDDKSINVRFDNESRQAIEKSNFDMKMKIYYLEEELRKVKNSHANGDDVDDLRSDVESLRLQLAEKGLELDQRK
jgi:phage terminase Nu1 subunit (DNA packaging protein)